MVCLLAYAYGGIAAHALFLAMHEISHNLLFATITYNRLFGMKEGERESVCVCVCFIYSCFIYLFMFILVY